MRTLRDLVLAGLLLILAASVPDDTVTVPGVLQVAGAALLIIAVLRLFVSLISLTRHRRTQDRLVTLMSMVAPPSLAHVLDPDLKARARHEAAHAVAAHILGATLHSVSTRPMGPSGGRTAWSAGTELSPTDRLVITVAGAVADEAREAEVTALPADDFTRAQRQAIAIAIRDGQPISHLLDNAIAGARTLLTTHSAAVDRLASALSARPRTLTGAQAITHIDG
jgi:hypothetical protein